MKILKKFIIKFFYVVIIFLILYIVTMIIAPEKVNNILSYKFYTVLTNSMEPEISTYSLVCIKKFEKDEFIDLKPQQIITFHANRFGTDIIITHRFNKIEKSEDGTVIYRTNAEGKDTLDYYQVKRDDLIGTYIFHIPYIGKFILFLKSKFSFILYGEIIIILLIEALIKSLYQEKTKKLSKWINTFENF